MSDFPHVRTVIRSVVLATMAGAGAALLLAFAVSRGGFGPDPGPLHGGGWTSRSRAWLEVRGIHGTEFSGDAMEPFNWTSGGVRLQIPAIDRSRSYQLVFETDAPRPAELGPAEVRWTIDGVPAGQAQIAATPDRFIVRLPTSDRTRAVITMEIGPTFQPGPSDERRLGFIVRRVTLTPEHGGWTVTTDVLWRVAAAVSFVVLGVMLCGVSTLTAVATAVVVPVAFAWLTLQDAAFLGTYAATLMNLGLGGLVIGVALAAVRTAVPTAPAVREGMIAAGIVLAVSLVKLAFFSHPLATIGDGVFQVHRSALVQTGSYFFTSITPRPFFEFPYAIALFVTAKPFWPAFTQDVDHVWLLRTLSLVADALVGIALYVAARRVWARPRAALLIAVLWPFARAPFEALCNANLPNVFGQGLFGVAMAVLIWSLAIGRRVWAGVAVAALVLAAAFLSHFSTFLIGVPLVAVIGLATSVRAGADAMRRLAVVAGVGVVALLLAWGLYYRHFMPVYRATIDRVVSEEVVEAPGSAIAASPATKFRRWLTGGSDDYGLPGAPLAAAAVAGMVLLIRERRQDVLTRALAGWLLAWIAFSVLGILTAVQMRANLATAPVFVCFGAWAIATLADRGRTGVLLAAVAVLAIVWNALSLWFMCIGH